MHRRRTRRGIVGAFDDFCKAVGAASMVYLWANARPHESLVEYGEALDSAVFDDGTVHVMLNSYMPLRANARKFDGCKMYSINRRISDSGRFHGSSEFMRFRHMMAGSFISTDQGELFDLTTVASADVSDCVLRLSSGSGLVPVFRLYDGERLKDYPPSSFGPTTGFQCYMLVRAVCGAEKAVLCNFSISDSSYDRAASMHGIDFEVDTYAREGCARLFI